MKLEEIKNPDFLRGLDEGQLRELCQEIRRFIVRTVSRTGGHLSSNLGTVELTVALHRVFHLPEDKIIFDVGHQSYTHKILTGRAGQFSTLRQLDGLSGFQSRAESPYDCYEGGHSSTSLSAALGFAMARDLQGRSNAVVAVIGDGSMGNGMAYEALNHIGDYRRPLIVVLNDNDMSISKNVGALHNALERIRVGSGYTRAKTLTKTVLGRVPVAGDSLVSSLERAKKAVKRVYLRGSAFFEEMGFRYYGPVDGHNIRELEAFLEMAKSSPTPVIIHVITQKGRGFSYSQEDPDGRWHGVGAFDASKGRIFGDPSHTTYSQVVADALADLSRRDPRIMVVTPAMATGAKLLSYQQQFPRRFVDVGIAEEHALVLANALALDGEKPFVSIYSTFLQRGYDQVIHDIARMGGNVVLGVERCGIVGEDGVSHQGIYDLSLFLPVPGVAIAQPRNAGEATRLLATAFACGGPFLLRYSKNPIASGDGSLEPLPLGSWERLAPGDDLTLITYGDLVEEALSARKSLEAQGILMGVINARFLKPIDAAMFHCLLKEGRPLLVCEEAAEIGSLGSFLTLEASRLGSSCPISVLGIPDQFVPHGNRRLLLRRLGLDAQGICARVQAMVTGLPGKKI